MKKCPFCQKDIEANATTCPHCQKSLLADASIIKTAVEEGVKPLQTSVEKATTDIKAIADRVAKIEALPLNKLGVFSVNTIASEYKGYKLAEQGRVIRDIALRNPTRFKALADEGKANEFCKWMIAVTKALKGDLDARAELKEIYAKAQMQEDTAAEGGYLVPQEYEWDMVQLARAASFALNECSVINMTRDIINLPSEATLVSVAWTAEESAATETEPTFGQVQLNARRLDGFGKVTNELLQDSAIDIVSILAEQFSYAIGQELDNQVLNGTGTPCSGVLTSAVGTDVKFASTQTNFSEVTATYLSQLIYSLNSGYLAGARFIINRLGLHYVRTLKDSQNRPIFADIGGGTIPPTIYGFPYFMSEKITNTTAAETAYIAFGQFKKFYIGRRIGASAIDLDPYTYFKENATQFRYITRWGMKIGNSAAFARALTATS
jgi:HK97 family phage major capsid protein